MPRSLKKGPFVASYVVEKVEQMNASGKKDTIKTFSHLNLQNLIFENTDFFKKKCPLKKKQTRDFFHLKKKKRDHFSFLFL